MGTLFALFFSFKGAIFIGPSPIFLGKLGTSLIEAPLWTPPPPAIVIGTNVLLYGPPIKFPYTRVELWAQKKPYGINLRFYWERLGVHLGNAGNLMGTL